jgi:hypothetical protein
MRDEKSYTKLDSSKIRFEKMRAGRFWEIG